MVRRINITRGDQGEWFVKHYAGSGAGTKSEAMAMHSEMMVARMATRSTPAGEAIQGVKNTDIGKTVYWATTAIITADVANAIVQAKKVADNGIGNFYRENLIRATQSRVAGGTSVTDLSSVININAAVEGHKQFLPYSNHMQKIINNTDFNDPASLERLEKAIHRYGKIHGIDGLDTKFDFASASEAENALAIAIAMTSGATIGDIGKNKYLNQQIKALENNIKNSVGIDKLTEAGFKKELYGRIASGEIDVDEVIEKGTFCGVEIDETMKSALVGLKTFATGSTLAFQAQGKVFSNLAEKSNIKAFHNDDTLVLCRKLDAMAKKGIITIPEGLPNSFAAMSLDDLKSLDLKSMFNESNLSLANKWDLKIKKELIPVAEMNQRHLDSNINKLSKKVNLNSIKQVSKQVQAMSQVIDKARIPGIKGSVAKMSDKKLLKLIKGGKLTKEQSESLRALLTMRSQLRRLQSIKAARRELRAKARMILMKITGANQSDVVQGINTTRQMVRGVKLALKTARRVGRITFKPARYLMRKMTRKVRMRFSENINELEKMLTQAKEVIVKAADKAKQAAKKSVDKAKEKATQWIYSKVSGKTKAVLEKLQKRHSARSKLRKAKAARRKTKKLLKVGGRKSILAPFKKIALAMVKVIIIAVVVITLLDVIGRLIIGSMTTIASFEDALLSFKDAIENFFNPDASEEDKANVLYWTLDSLVAEENETNNAAYWVEQYELGGRAFYRFVDPTTHKVSKVNANEDDSVINEKSLLEFREVTSSNSEYYYYMPTNDYSVTKLVLSMAHAFTMPIEKENDIQIFTKYSIGLWHHLKDHILNVSLKLTPETSGNYNYVCNSHVMQENSKTGHYEKVDNKDFDSALYSYILKSNQTYGTIINVGPTSNTSNTIKADSTNTMVIIDDDIAPQTDLGCRVTYYNGKGRGNTYVTGTSEIVSVSTSELVKLSTITNPNTWMNDYVNSGSNISFNNQSNPLYRTYYLIKGDKKHGVVNYTADPIIDKHCAEEEFKENFNLYDDSDATKIKLQSFINNFTYCTPDKIANGKDCNNHTHVYCSGCVITGKSYHGNDIMCTDGDFIDHMIENNNAIGCENYKTINLYYCKGHKGYHAGGNAYSEEILKSYGCNDYELAYEIPEIGYKAYRCKGNCIVYCNGYQGTMPMKVPCMNSTTKTEYICLGHDIYECPNGHDVCLGHMSESACEGHYYCDGHSLVYCTGDPQYTLITNILSVNNEKDVFSNSWTYTKYYSSGFLFFTWTDSESYNPIDFWNDLWDKKDNQIDNSNIDRCDDIIWDPDNRTVMLDIFNADWYKDYGISSSRFVNGELSKSEQNDILKALDVTEENTTTERLRVIKAALDTVGRVPYAPQNNYAIGYNLETNKFFNPVPKEEYKTENNLLYGIKGLDKKYFADYVVWSGTYDDKGGHTRNVYLNPTSGKMKIESSTYLNKCSKISKSSMPLPGDVLIYTQNGKVIDTAICVNARPDTNLSAFFTSTSDKDNPASYISIVRLGNEYAKVDTLTVTNDTVSLIGGSESTSQGTWYIAKNIY